MQEHESLCNKVADVQVDNPVHEIETDEADRENYSRVFVYVARRESVELVEVLVVVRRHCDLDRRGHDGGRWHGHGGRSQWARGRGLDVLVGELVRGAPAAAVVVGHAAVGQGAVVGVGAVRAAEPAVHVSVRVGVGVRVGVDVGVAPRPASLDRVLQRPAVGVHLWIVDLVAYLLALSQFSKLHLHPRILPNGTLQESFLPMRGSLLQSDPVLLI